MVITIFTQIVRARVYVRTRLSGREKNKRRCNANVLLLFFRVSIPKSATWPSDFLMPENFLILRGPEHPLEFKIGIGSVHNLGNSKDTRIVFQAALYEVQIFTIP